MKHAHLVTLLVLLVSIFVIGCSQRSNPISQDHSTDSGITTVVAERGSSQHNDVAGMVTPNDPAGPLFITIPEYDSVSGTTEMTSTINATTGGTIKAKIIYYKNGDKVFSLSAQIKFPVGCLDSTRTITVRMDPSILGFEFLPHGINFGKPALLTIDTWGLDLTGFSSNNTELWYKENGEWLESYQGRMIKIFPQNGKLMVTDIQLRHFSVYAFGRRKISSYKNPGNSDQ